MTLKQQQNNLILENPTKKGEYTSLKLIDDRLIHHNFKYIIRSRSETNYLFVFKYEGIPIFIKKKYDEVLELIANGTDKVMINPQTKIMVLFKMDSDKIINSD